MHSFFAHLWDELDELQGLVWHGAVGVAADLRSLARALHGATSAALARLSS